MEQDSLFELFDLAQRASPEEIHRQGNDWQSELFLRQIIDAVPSLLLILNEQRQVVFANQGLLKTLEIEDYEAALGQRPGELLDCVHADETEDGCGTTSYCRTCGAAIAILASLVGVKAMRECHIVRSGGQGTLSLRVWTTPLQFKNQRFSIFTVEDIRKEEEVAQLLTEVRRLAVTDALTGAFNRRHFYELAQNELQRAQRYHHPTTIIILDIDFFKQINDDYGHLVGDQVLRALADRWRSNLRSADMLGRFGGEEFVILLPETDPPKALAAAERLRQVTSELPVETVNVRIPVTISLGVSVATPGEETDLDTLLDRADQARCAAKRAGRNTVIMK